MIVPYTRRGILCPGHSVEAVIKGVVKYVKVVP